jgi:HEAT repeat protein
MIWALRHPEPSTALRAATILGKLKAQEAAEPLAETLEDRAMDPYVRAAAAVSVGQIGSEKVRTALVRTLEHGPVSVRLAAAEALGALGPNESTADALRRASEEDGSSRVREVAKEMLAGWRDRA